MKERILFSGGTSLLLTVCVTWALSFGNPAQAEIAVADWTLNTADGGTVNFHDTLAKGPVVISFWATWCKPCLKEMSHLNRMAGEYEGQVTFLAVNADNSKSVAKVAPFLSAKGYNNLVVPLDTGAELSSLLQVTGIVPFLIVFDGQGREIYRHVGYKEGDEEELQHEIENLLSRQTVGLSVETGKPAWAEAVSATDKFKYSYSTETEKEIFENWLDVSYQFGGFRTGIMLNSQAPSEDGDRRNEIVHRFFEFDSGQYSLRAGHFYGLFGRGMLFNSYEDRVIRIDTRLDGIIASTRQGGFNATVFSGTPSGRALDIRGADVEYNIVDNLFLAGSGMTYRSDNGANAANEVFREWVGSVRARHNFGFGDFYVEHGWKTGYDYNRLTDEADQGKAFYANLNLYAGPFSISWENSRYERFAVVKDADGKTTLNRPPSLAREFAWTLLNRSPHNMDADDEKGNNLDVIYSNDQGWTLLASGAQLENLDNETVYELAFGSVQKDNLGPFRLTGGFGYQDNEGQRQTAVGEITWMVDETHSWTLQVEHQHVRLGGGYGYDLGAYDIEWFKLEYETAPRWAFAAMFETNNKYDDQPPTTEKKGPFPAGQITYTISRGGNMNLWFGSRQEGYLCSGGVCKYEPAFEGVEIYGLFRY
jgi:cytochrome c biogenesis protein CcmG, thiol:disulfide interchange protein DsbE